MKKRRTLALILCIVLVATATINVDAATKKYSLSVTPSIRGEFNITVKGKLTQAPILYKKNIFGKKTKVSNAKATKSNGNWIIECSLEKKKKYVVDCKVSSGTPTINCVKNRDKYSSSSSLSKKSIQWTPKANSYQPYDLSNTYVVQVVYLTKEETMAYALNLKKNEYLKLLDTSVSLGTFMTTAGISAKSALGKAIKTIGKSELAEAAKIVVTTYGGLSLVPSLREGLEDTVCEASKNYTTGIKITVMSTLRGGLTNSYSNWDGKKSTVYGESGCRGSFSTKVKLKGWY